MSYRRLSISLAVISELILIISTHPQLHHLLVHLLFTHSSRTFHTHLLISPLYSLFVSRQHPRLVTYVTQIIHPRKLHLPETLLPLDLVHSPRDPNNHHRHTLLLHCQGHRECRRIYRRQDCKTRQDLSATATETRQGRACHWNTATAPATATTI
ncbi:hypothetical protein F5H01DRAFT_341484 [Linnemannia elongata]|nr:hypothetical protein F5H01DRAFT_341484 [Linnemannia elongata]